MNILAILQYFQTELVLEKSRKQFIPDDQTVRAGSAPNLPRIQWMELTCAELGSAVARLLEASDLT